MILIPEAIYHKIQYIGIKLMNIIQTFYEEINEIIIEKTREIQMLFPTLLISTGQHAQYCEWQSSQNLSFSGVFFGIW